MLNRTLALWCVFVLPLPLFLLFTYLAPLGQIMVTSLGSSDLTLANYIEVLNNPAIQVTASRTFRICLITSITSVCLAYFLSYFWVFGSRFIRAIVELAILLPFWISVLSKAFGWLIMLRPTGLINSTLMSLHLISAPLALVRNELGIVIGMTHFLVPFAVFPIASVMRQLDRRVFLAARGMGAGPVRRFFEIFLPLTTSGILSAFFLVFVLALGFFVTPSILGGGRVIMVAEYIYRQLLITPNWGVATATSGLLLLSVCLIFLLTYRFTRSARSFSKSARSGGK